MPRTDPRYLSATDEDILSDLLSAMYLSGERRRADAAVAVVERYLQNREVSEQEDLEFTATVEPGGALYDRMVAFGRRASAKSEGRRVRKIRSASVRVEAEKGDA